MKKIINLLFLIFFTFPLFSQWKEFTEKYGTGIPSVNNNYVLDYQVKVNWFKETRSALEKYAILIIMEFNCRNFQVEDIKQVREPLYWSWTGNLIRGGVKTKFHIDFSSPFYYSPKEFVEKYELDWNTKRNILISEPWRIKEQLFEGFEIVSWKQMFFWEPEPQKCEVVFSPGTVCTFDLGSGTVNIVPKP